jgi:thioredoxin-related protein
MLDKASFEIIPNQRDSFSIIPQIQRRKPLNMIKLLIASCLLLSLNGPVWEHDLSTAKAQAAKEHKYILLNFSGSDWCIPCIRLHNEIFESGYFAQFAADNLVLVNADFPRKNKNQLSKEQQKLNEALADKYNPKGSFPYTLLLDSEGNKVKVWDGFYKDGVANFVAEIKEATGK